MVSAELQELLDAIKAVYQALGPPGHYGYDSKEGKALKQLYDAYNRAAQDA